MIKDFLTFKGTYVFTNTVTGKDYIFKNVVTQNFFTAVLNNLLNGSTCSLSLTQIAVGTGTNTALKSDTALQTEILRKNISTKTVSPTAITGKAILLPADAVATLREVGVFAGDVLISRANVNIVKDANTQYLVTYILEVY